MTDDPQIATLYGSLPKIQTFKKSLCKNRKNKRGASPKMATTTTATSTKNNRTVGIESGRKGERTGRKDGT